MSSNWNDIRPVPNHETHSIYKTLAVCVLLMLAIGLVFGQTVHHEFLNFDDDAYVFKNPQVVRGLTTEGIEWAFTHVHANNWHPLTSISHMIDSQFYGLNPWGHHLTNVLLHGANAILLFLVLLRMTGRFWPSAFVAMVFAVHPLRAESVAWVSERKDVLSGLFFMLTLGAYVEYTRRPSKLTWYITVIVLFALGLMAKPMLVTLPVVMLLLDYWPLGRMASSAAEDGQTNHKSRVSLPVHLVLEKLPLLALVVASCVATLLAQRESRVPLDFIPMTWRLGNAIVSYVAYIGQLFYPLGLAVYYPHPGATLPAWRILGASLILLGITIGAFAARRRNSYLWVGWLWYLVTLVPVIGLVQVGSQAMADRYTYLTQIGLVIAVTWYFNHVQRSLRQPHWVGGVASVLIVSVLIGLAWRQVSFWRDDYTLWAHTLASTSRNAVAHNNLGNALAAMGRNDEAMEQYQKSLEIVPNFAEAHWNLGNIFTNEGRIDESIIHFKKALDVQPDYAAAHNNLGNALVAQGKFDEAVIHFKRAIELKPDYPEAHWNLANAFAAMGKNDEAMEQYQKSLEIVPNFAEAHCHLGNVLVREHRGNEAVIQFQKALELKPDFVEAQNNLAWLLSTWPEASSRNGSEAVILAQRAVTLSGGGEPGALDTLAAAYAEAGRFPEAIETARKAIEIAKQQKRQSLVAALKSRLSLYEAGIPYHEKAATW